MSITKICIIGLDDFAMLTGDTSYGYIGGESVQHVLLARAWRDLGLDVSIIVHDHGQPHVTSVDGIRAVTCYGRDEGLKGVRYVHPRMTSVLRAMREVDADLYYQSPAAGLAGVVAAFAIRHGKRSVVRIASDSDCLRPNLPLGRRVDRWLYEYGLRHASLVAAQTERQRDLLLRNFGVHSEIVNIAVDPPSPPRAREKDVDVLWVGNIRPVKRPDIVLELARRRPRYRFVLVGGSARGEEGQAYFSRIARQAQSLPNVLLTGTVPYEEVGGWFDRARLHVNTSDYEGFPNTFLQAWIRRVPVVSFFDPDNLIERRGLGRRCRDLEDMCSTLDELLGNPDKCAAIGQRGHAAVSTQYSAREIATRYLELIERRDPVSAITGVDTPSVRAANDT